MNPVKQRLVEGVIVSSDIAIDELASEALGRTKVTFKDGSSCDVQTGEINLREFGTILLCTPNPNPSSKFKIKMAVSAPVPATGFSLKVREFDFAEIHVKTGERFLIELEGSRADFERFQFIVEDGGPIIRGIPQVKKSEPVPANRTGHLGGGGINIAGDVKGSIVGLNLVGCVNVGGESAMAEPDPVRIEITVPSGTVLELLGNTRGCFITSSGSSELVISDINSRVKIVAKDESRVFVQKSVIYNLTVDSYGNSHVQVQGRVKEAALIVRGSGHVHVVDVKQEPTMAVKKGNGGKIVVDNWPGATVEEF